MGSATGSMSCPPVPVCTPLLVSQTTSSIQHRSTGSPKSPVSFSTGGGTRGVVLPTGVSGGGAGGTFMTGGGLLSGKSVISVQSKRLADDVNHVYDRQIMFTNKIQSQQGRIEDLKFRIAKTEKELVSSRFLFGWGG